MKEKRRLTEKEIKAVLRIGKGNAILNKYTIPVMLPLVLISSVLIIGGRFANSSAVIFFGMILLILPCMLLVTFFMTLCVMASKCKVYSYQLYQNIINRYPDVHNVENMVVYAKENKGDTKNTSR